MAKFDSLIFFKERIESRIEFLNDIQFECGGNNPNLEINGLKAIIKLIDEVKELDETRWGRAPLKSKKNLSWIFVKNINPVLSCVLDIRGIPITQIQVLKVSEHSKADHFSQFAIFLSKYTNLKSSEFSLVSYISELTRLLLAHYSPKTNKRKVKQDDYPFCLYCYRECYRKNIDVCDKHSGANRSNAKKILPRYSKLKEEFEKYDKDKGRGMWFNAFAINALKENNITAWANIKSDEDKICWLIDVLTKFDIYKDNYSVDQKAKHIIKSSTDDISFFPNWPSGLNGTMFRFQAYELAKIRRPTTEMAKKLNMIWSGKSVSSIALKFGLQRTGLQRQVGRWKREICELKSIGVPDQIIKITLELEYLP